MPDMTSGRQIAASKLRRQSRQRQTYCRETGPPERQIGRNPRTSITDHMSGPGSATV